MSVHTARPEKFDLHLDAIGKKQFRLVHEMNGYQAWHWHTQNRMFLLKDGYRISEIVNGTDGFAKQFHSDIALWIQKVRAKDMDKARNIRNLAQQMEDDATFIESMHRPSMKQVQKGCLPSSTITQEELSLCRDYKKLGQDEDACRKRIDDHFRPLLDAALQSGDVAAARDIINRTPVPVLRAFMLDALRQHEQTHPSKKPERSL